MSQKDSKEIDSADKTTHLISLITNQDSLAHNWIKTLLTIESALAVAFIFLLKDFEPSATFLPEWYVRILAGLIPLLGAFSAIIIGVFVSRELKWQSWFIDSYNRLCNWDQAVFPTRTNERVEPDLQQRGFFNNRLRTLCGFLALVWLVVGVTTFIALGIG